MKFTTLIATLAFSHVALTDLILPKQLTAQQLVKEIGSMVEAKIQQNLKVPQIQIQVTKEQVSHLPPIGPFMPQFKINGNQVQMKNVFDEDVNKQIQQIQKEMDQRVQRQRKIMEERMKRKFKQHKPLIGEGDHDNWKFKNENQPLIGEGDHDNWRLKNENQPLIGGGEHDNWDLKKKWKHQKKQWKHQSKQWKHQKNKEKHDQAWKNRQISSQQVMPYLVQTFPAFEGGNIVAVINKGFNKGFNINVIYQDKDGKEFNIDAVYRPKREEFLVKKMEQTPLILGRNQQSQKRIFQERLQTVPQFISRQNHHKAEKDFMIPPQILEKKRAEKQAQQEKNIPPQQIQTQTLASQVIQIPAQIQKKIEANQVISLPIQHPILGGQKAHQNQKNEEILIGKDQIAEKEVMQNDNIKEIQEKDIDQDIQNLEESQLALKKK